MIIAQAILVTPIIAALTRQIIEDLWGEYSEHLRSLNAGPLDTLGTLIYGRPFLPQHSRACRVRAGDCRSWRGDDRRWEYRSCHPGDDNGHCAGDEQGNLATALGLGIVLLVIALAVNAGVQIINAMGARKDAIA